MNLTFFFSSFSSFLFFPASSRIDGSIPCPSHITLQQAQRGDNETFYMKPGENLVI